MCDQNFFGTLAPPESRFGTAEPFLLLNVRIVIGYGAQYVRGDEKAHVVFGMGVPGLDWPR